MYDTEASPPAPPQLAARTRPDGSILTYGWRYDPSLPADDNFLDLARAISRNSTSKYGCMGAVLVAGPAAAAAPSPDAAPSGEAPAQVPASDPDPDPPEVLAYAINTPLPRTYDSAKDCELHAEANAIAQCERDGVATRGATVYITFPPCKTCFALLCDAGVKRMVFRRRITAPAVVKLAAKADVDLVEFNDPAVEAESVARVRKLWDGFYERYPHLLPDKVRKRKQQRALEAAETAGKAHKAGAGAGPSSSSCRKEGQCEEER